MRKKYKKLILGVSITLAILGVIIMLIDIIPPRSLTHGAMHMSKRRILRYAHQNNKLPENIDILPEISEYSNRIKDAWNRKLIYNINQDNTITLISYGRDGIQGGDGDSKDMIGIFSYKKENGEWENELCDWIKDPFKN